MTESIILSSASLRCEIKPEPGGCIAGLWLGETAVLRSTPVSDRVSVRHAGSYPLMQNNGPDPHAIHGLDWQRPWQVLDQEEKLLMLACEHQTDVCWPFALGAGHPDFGAGRIDERANECPDGTCSMTRGGQTVYCSCA